MPLVIVKTRTRRTLDLDIAETSPVSFISADTGSYETDAIFGLVVEADQTGFTITESGTLVSEPALSINNSIESSPVAFTITQL